MQSETDLRHVHAAYRALRPGGRLVAITSPECTHASSGWRVLLGRCQPPPDVLFTAPIAGKLYQSRGTTYETRPDRHREAHAHRSPAPRGTPPRPHGSTRHPRAALLEQALERLPARAAPHTTVRKARANEPTAPAATPPPPTPAASKRKTPPEGPPATRTAPAA